MTCRRATEGKGPQRMKIWGKFLEGRQKGEQERNNKSWCGCYLSSLGMAGEVKGGSKKPPLLPG